MNIQLNLNIRIFYIFIIFLIGCTNRKLIPIDDIGSLKNFDLSRYEKTTHGGINYYLLSSLNDYTINGKQLSDSTIDFQKYGEQNRIYLLETHKPNQVIGFLISLINDKDAKTVINNLKIKRNLPFTLDTAHAVDYGYNFAKKNFENFNRTFISIIIKDNRLNSVRKHLINTYQKQLSKKMMKQPYYQLDFSALLCKFEIKVNDIEVLSMNVDGQTATDIPINAAIFGSGLQKIEVKGYPLNGTKKNNAEAYIRYKVVEYEVGTGEFIFSRNFEKYQTPAIKEGEPFIYHTSTFMAEVPYELQSWNTLRNIKNLKTDIAPALTKAYQRLIKKAKEGDYKPLIDAIKVVEDRNSKTMYLSDQDTKQRIKSILDDINDGFSIIDLPESRVLSYGGNGKLVRFVRTDGNSALALESDKTNEQIVLDFWFSLPNESEEFQVF
ncbi:hypothetical protein ACUN24_05490 [Pedobacter sp. WC2501]|uniref:hypothetical protein n=1 Tax=Pedobacter sp. WC2501 TaxID=3461400 RepID=UPI004045BAE9